ncbi:DUF5320 domain-containing protein [Candidatus Woesearchaeota archaeon]|nr:DUF5320 domain-containing protein [Candidatus Woesearchaeota archaeon]
MPMRNGTGPYGEGQLTGRGLGPCGRGLRRGFGREIGFRRMANVPAYEPVELSKEQKVKILEAEKTEIEAELKAIEKEIKENKK